MSKKPNSAWERRNLYAKRLTERNASLKNKTAVETENDSCPPTEDCDANKCVGIRMQPIKLKQVTKNKTALPNNTSTTIKCNTSAARIIPPTFSIHTKKQVKGAEVMPTKTTNNAQTSNLTVDPGLFKFIAKPATLPAKRPAVIKKAQIIPSTNPNRRKSITKKSPRLFVVKHKSTKYVVPSRIDTGLRKKITQKTKVTSKHSLESASDVIDLNNPQPGPSKLINEPTEVKETPAASAISLGKKRKISFGTITPSRVSLRKKVAPVSNPSKKPKVVLMSEKKLQDDKNKIMFFGKEVQNYENWVKEQQNNADEDIEKKNPVLEDKLIATPVNSQPLKKRSKSVSFKVPDSVRRTPLLLPRTPCTKPSLRKNLEDFAETKGLNTAYIRHLHCLGKELSEVKRNKSMKRTRSSTPNLRIRVAPSPITPRASSPIQTDDQDLHKALQELKQVIDSGLDLHQAADWLQDIENFYPQFQKLAVYWELKALLLEKKDDFAGAVEVFDHAAGKIDEDQSEVFQETVSNFMDRMPSKTVTEVSINDKENKDLSKKRRTPRKAINVTPNLDTNIVKFVNAKNSSTAKRLFKSFATPNEISSILTPVRRSVRLASASKAVPDKSVIDLQEMGSKELSEVIFVPNPFL